MSPIQFKKHTLVPIDKRVLFSVPIKYQTHTVDHCKAT